LVSVRRCVWSRSPDQPQVLCLVTRSRTTVHDPEQKHARRQSVRLTVHDRSGRSATGRIPANLRTASHSVIEGLRRTRRRRPGVAGARCSVIVNATLRWILHARQVLTDDGGVACQQHGTTLRGLLQRAHWQATGGIPGMACPPPAPQLPQSGQAGVPPLMVGRVLQPVSTDVRNSWPSSSPARWRRPGSHPALPLQLWPTEQYEISLGTLCHSG